MSRTLTSEKEFPPCSDKKSCLLPERADTDGRNSRGLKNIARLVSIKISEKGTTCYREIADEIIQELSNMEENSLTDERSIRRRVYDALNILLAMNFIQKERRSIRWQGPRLAWNNEDTDKRTHNTPPSTTKHSPNGQSLGFSSQPSKVERNSEFVKKPFLVLTIPGKVGSVCKTSTGDFQRLKLRSSKVVQLFDENTLNRHFSKE